MNTLLDGSVMAALKIILFLSLSALEPSQLGRQDKKFGVPGNILHGLISHLLNADPLVFLQTHLILQNTVKFGQMQVFQQFFSTCQFYF